MPHYRGLDGDTSVASYELGKDAITVAFKDGWHYLYTWAIPGRDAVEQMKDLARAGRGLDLFIREMVRKRFARRWL